ncbi:hypothetical protein WICMUC_002333 [Wickerhamomyces mucosus]|uniref:Uncharacterized protein n=1 Tax=Wickerhamomyces mucosus TaxID=1378264 RepID=A0A9P8PPT1_9ASCO|nr:hypothetical protein WICMUC_002333 [Wickerhamomyces mucosus]
MIPSTYLVTLIVVLFTIVVNANTEAFYYKHKGSSHTNSNFNKNDSLIDIQPPIKIDQVYQFDAFQYQDEIESSFDQIYEYLIPIEDSIVEQGLYNLRISWDALDPIEISKFDLLSFKDYKEGLNDWIYLKYKYDAYPEKLYRRPLDFKILISSTILGIPLDMLPVLKIIIVNVFISIGLSFAVYKFLIKL